METSNNQDIVPSTLPITIENHKKEIVQNTAKTDVLIALNALDGIYKNNIRTYAEGLHACTQQIEDAKNRLEVLYKEIEPHSTTLLIHQKEIDFELRTLERFSQEWKESMLVIHALEKELSQLNHSKQAQEQILKNRQDTMNKLNNDIIETEIRLLKHELQKQNIVLLLEPTKREVTVLELHIKKLKSQKHYIESAYLHNLSPLPQSNNPVRLEHQEDTTS
jgi:chromosome segregation ATPase